MASVTLQVRDVFPPTTSVGAYKRSNWTTTSVPSLGTAPPGSADVSATVVADGTLAFSGLTASTEYVAGAQVSGVWTFRSFSSPSTTATDVDAALANTASLTELTAGSSFTQTETTQQNGFILIAMFPLKIVACSLFFNASNAGDGTNRWRFDLNRVRNNSFATIAQRSNWGGDGAGGASIQPATEWSFDAQPFDANNQICQKGDGVCITHVLVGAPPSFGRRCYVVRYEPL